MLLPRVIRRLSAGRFPLLVNTSGCWLRRTRYELRRDNHKTIYKKTSGKGIKAYGCPFDTWHIGFWYAFRGVFIRAGHSPHLMLDSLFFFTILLGPLYCTIVFKSLIIDSDCRQSTVIHSTTRSSPVRNMCQLSSPVLRACLIKVPYLALRQLPGRHQLHCGGGL
jgi:hypothetical protein